MERMFALDGSPGLRKSSSMRPRNLLARSGRLFAAHGISPPPQSDSARLTIEQEINGPSIARIS
jgi:hypothetical protein